MSSTDSQSRKYILTINDPREHGFDHDLIIDRMHLFHPRYFCLADEIATTGTYHTHAFLLGYSPIRFSTVKRRFPTAHIEAAHGSAKENRDYVRKEGKWGETAKAETSVAGTFFEFGELPTEAEETAPKMH